jgi:arginine repressor
LNREDEDAVLEYLVSDGWRQQEEIVAWLLAERGVVVSRPTVSRVLKRRRWTEKGVLKIRGARVRGKGKGKEG